MENPNNPGSAVTGDSDVASAVGESNDSALTLEAINKAVGREYGSVEDAIKGLNETYSYVGDAPKLKKDLEEANAKLVELSQPKKGKADEVKELTETVQNLKKQNEINDWYQANPEYIPLKAVISKLGDNPAEVVGNEDNKQILDAVMAQTSNKPRNTVMDSNSQPSPSKSYQDEFAQAQESGDWSGLVLKHHMPQEEEAA